LISPQDSQIDYLKNILREHDSFSFIKVTPTHLKALKGELSSEIIEKQKGALIIGGEDLQVEDIRFWLEAAPKASIFNEYGPTETTVGCSVFRVGKDSSLSSRSISIGRPISNTQIYILDDYMNPVPMGVVGEIYIGGAGLARGYLNRA